jgi:hypothetical protein
LDLKLAKAQNPQEVPKVSKLPLPISDSPLVIDLPDGQKIVVGKMTQGSVIEVATWRGVGRPDSRTSRLMLGVGVASAQQDSESSESSQQSASTKVKPTGWRSALYYFNEVSEKISSFNLSTITKNFGVKRSEKKVRRNSRQRSDAINSSEHEKQMGQIEGDVEAWLNQIQERAANKGTKAVTSTKTRSTSKTSARKPIKKQATSKTKRK